MPKRLKTGAPGFEEAFTAFLGEKREVSADVDDLSNTGVEVLTGGTGTSDELSITEGSGGGGGTPGGGRPGPPLPGGGRRRERAVRVVIIGAGKIGRHLARELADAGHAVTVAEIDGEVARQLAESVDALVLEGDGTSMSILKDAEVSRADWLLAVTGQDEVNLTACELAETMGADRVLARLNDPRNRATFDALGIPVVAVTDLISQLISREIDFFHLERIALLARGRISLIEVEVGPDIPARKVVDLGLPAQTVIVAVTREKDGGEVLVPRGDTVIEPGDRVLAVTSVDHEPEVRAALRRPAAAQGNDH